MILKVAIVYFIIGLLFFYTSATFSMYNELPDWLYYWWAKGLDVLLWLSVYKISNYHFKKILKPVIVFSIIRFVWDIVSYFTGVSVNNSVLAASLFMLLIIIILYLFLKELTKWQP